MKHFLGIFSLATLLLFTSCQKNVDTFVPDSIQSAPDTEWKSAITADMPVSKLKNDLRLSKILDSFTYNNTGIVFNAASLSLGIPAGGLISIGGLVPIGSVTRNTLLVQKKGDFIAMSMPTVSNGRLLLSGGAFFLGLKNNGNDLSVTAGNSLTVKYNADNILGGLKVFNGTEDLTSGFNWTENTDVAFNKVIANPTGYDVLINRLQWVQPAYLFDTTGIMQTNFAIKLPENFTNTNTVAYVSFNDMPCVSGMTANVSAKKFQSGNLPVNRPVTVVVISRQVNDYYFGSQQTATAVPSSGAGVQEIQINPVRVSLPAIRSFLNNL